MWCIEFKRVIIAVERGYINVPIMSSCRKMLLGNGDFSKNSTS